MNYQHNKCMVQLQSIFEKVSLTLNFIKIGLKRVLMGWVKTYMTYIHKPQLNLETLHTKHVQDVYYISYRYAKYICVYLLFYHK